MCECIKEIEKKLKESLFEQNPGAIITESPTLDNKVLMLDTGSIELYSPVSGKFTIGNRKKKFGVNMRLTFCPFCGEKVKERK